VSDPELVPRNALSGQRVAISVSESSDLSRLGLTHLHLDLAVAELSRAIVIAGGVIVFGGAINLGFTNIVLDEAERYGRATAFEHLVPYTEHAHLQPDEMRAYAASLGVRSRVRLIDADGIDHAVTDSANPNFARRDLDEPAALTAMRDLAARTTSARVIVGGRVAGFRGSIPGVAEEAAATVRAGKPLYIAGGFGGASTLVGTLVAPSHYGWLPPGLPNGLSDDVRTEVTSRLNQSLAGDGLTEDERAVLAATYRPSEIATLVVLGLSRQVGLQDPQ
jgi:hypothetical protein